MSLTLNVILNVSVFLFQVKSLVFDQSGTYLAVGGSDIRVYICKQWSEVLNFTGEADLKGQSINSCSSCMQVTLFCFLCLTLFFFSSLNCRPYRTGDWSGLWRQRSVLGLSRNGQKSQILQFVDGFKFKKKRQNSWEVDRVVSMSEQSLSWTPAWHIPVIFRGKKLN